MKYVTLKKIPRLSIILMLSIMYGCDQSSNPTSSHEVENSKMVDLQLLKNVSASETRITTSGTAMHINPAIDGNRIVWQDDRNSNSDIYLYNVSNGSESQITTDPNSQVEPAIDGKKIVWSDDRSLDASDIFMYNLATSSETQISDTPEPYNDIEPAISGDHIIWETYRWNIYSYNLNSGVTQLVGYQHAPKDGYDISGNLAVVSEYNGFTKDIRLYDFESDSYTWITSDRNFNSIYPSIDGNRIVWQDDRNGNYDIYFYDLSTDTETQITTNSSDQTDPVISGDYIVWTDNRDGNENIYFYDLLNKTEHQLTDNSAFQINPDISGNRIVWQDNRDGNWNIYYYEIQSDKSSKSGFTIGNGFIHSPAGAIVNNASKSGRAKFSLNARSINGELKGKATFKFNAGNIDLQSTSLNQIVVSGNTALINGTGTINGNGEYRFYISVVDEKLTGRNRLADKYRLLIVDSATQEVVYDNQMGDSEDAKATHPIMNGNILVKADDK